MLQLKEDIQSRFSQKLSKGAVVFLFRIVEFLADKFKASIYERTRDGSTLMHIAAVNGHPETAQILFERGVV